MELAFYSPAVPWFYIESSGVRVRVRVILTLTLILFVEASRLETNSMRKKSR